MIYSSPSFKRKLGLVSFMALASVSCAPHGFAMDEDQNKKLIQSIHPQQPQKTQDLHTEESAKTTPSLDCVQNAMDIETTKSILDVRPTSTKTPSRPTKVIQKTKSGFEGAFRPANEHLKKQKLLKSHEINHPVMASLAPTQSAASFMEEPLITSITALKALDSNQDPMVIEADTSPLASTSGIHSNAQEFDVFLKEIKTISIKGVGKSENFSLQAIFVCEDNKTYTYQYDLDKLMSLLPQKESELLNETFNLYFKTLQEKFYDQSTSPVLPSGVESLTNKFKVKILNYFLLTGKPSFANDDVIHSIRQLKNALDNHVKDHVGKTVSMNPRVQTWKTMLNAAILKGKKKPGNFPKESPLFLCLKRTSETDLPDFIKEIQHEHQQKKPALETSPVTTLISNPQQGLTRKDPIPQETNKRTHSVAFGNPPLTLYPIPGLRNGLQPFPAPYNGSQTPLLRTAYFRGATGLQFSMQPSTQQPPVWLTTPKTVTPPISFDLMTTPSTTSPVPINIQSNSFDSKKSDTDTNIESDSDSNSYTKQLELKNQELKELNKKIMSENEALLKETQRLSDQDKQHRRMIEDLLNALNDDSDKNNSEKF